MKLIFVFFLSIWSGTLLKAQDQAFPFQSTELISGYPEEVSNAVKLLSLTEVKYAELETGLDSLRLIFGSFVQDDRGGYWTGLYHEKGFEFMTVSLDKKIDSQLLTQNIEFKFKKSSMRTSFRVDYNPATEELYYQWLSPQGNSQVAYVQ